MMKMKILGYVAGNIICDCQEHQPDTFFVIPGGNVPLEPVGEFIEVEDDSIEEKGWISVADICAATDIARGDEFCIKAHNATSADIAERDRADWMAEYAEFDDECENCPENKGCNYDTGEVICSHRCMFE